MKSLQIMLPSPKEECIFDTSVEHKSALVTPKDLEVAWKLALVTHITQVGDVVHGDEAFLDLVDCSCLFHASGYLFRVQDILSSVAKTFLTWPWY